MLNLEKYMPVLSLNELRQHTFESKNDFEDDKIAE